MGMRRLAQRGTVVALAAGITVVLAAAAMAQSTGMATHTTLATGSQEMGGRTVTTYSATVLGEDGAPAKGIVLLQEQGRSVASAALNSEGKALMLAGGLTAGDHNLTAIYGGDAQHTASRSETIHVRSDATPSATPSFSQPALSPASLPATGQTLVPGDSGNVTVTITSVNGFTGFVSLSCAGAPVSQGSYTDNAMPFGVSCTFSPANLQITSAVANSSNPTVVSHLTVQTTAPAGANGLNRKPAGLPGQNSGNALALAVLLPGVLGLGVLGRKRKLFGRMALLLLVGGVTVLGASACNARYKYLNHPPTPNDGTVPGAYTLTVWAQTSDGVTASEQFTTLALTIAN
jgi:hypothetical protein